MKPIKNINFVFCVMAFFFLSIACEKLSTLNENPNEPEAAAMSNLLPSITKDLANLMVNQSFEFANNAAQLTAKSVRTEVDQYSWSGFDMWGDLYTILTDIKDLEDKAIESNNTAYEGVALVLKSYIYSILTDMHGPVPYSEALQGVSGNFTPAYDAQEVIYMGPNGLLAELARAGNLLNNSTEAINGDILFGGDLIKWKKFSTSLCLRLLIRVSEKENVAPNLADILSDPNNLINSNAENAELVYLGITPNQNPIAELKTGDFDDVRISENLVTAFQNTQDPRLGVYARPTDATINLPADSAAYEGWKNGCGASGSRLGYTYYDYPGHPTNGNKAHAIFMTYSEVQFLIAEAIERGLFTGNAATYYKNGIESSMAYYQVDFAAFGWADFDDYYNNATDVIYSNDLKQIWQQKWMALFFHGVEPYVEVRRWLDFYNNDWTQLPFLSPSCNNINNDLLPLRFIYPDNERLTNADNYDIAASSLGGNTQNTVMWLLK